MLVLSRKAGESICIGENITVEIRRVAGNRVTVALHAPKEVRILRGELRDAAEAFDDLADADARDANHADGDRGVAARYSVSLQRLTLPAEALTASA